MNARTWTGTLALALGAALLSLSLGSRAVPQPAAADAGAAEEFDPGLQFKLVGANRCSARGCHGGIQPLDPPGAGHNEYTIVLMHDKHADAYRVLFGERGQRICKNLGTVPNDKRCLACHTTPLSVLDEPTSIKLREEGVSCEACHGAAQKWVELHTQPAWRQNPERKRKDGMRALGDLTVRAQVCVGCHVGAPETPNLEVPIRDMNHDLIAAGHPRLNFEFAAFQANLPKHWREHDADQATEFRTWAVGQVVTAKAALELLAHRAKPAETVWPEFSEYDCFSCHHDLGASKEAPNWSWRQKRNEVGKPLGQFSWGAWYYSLLPTAVAIQGDAGKVSADLQELQKAMRKPYPDRAAVTKQAAALAGQLNQWLRKQDKKGFSTEALRGLRSRLAAADGKAVEINEWDNAVQLYLALLALNQSQPDPQVQKRADELAKQLAVPRDYDSPREFSPEIKPR